jgi:hypothetical protein
VAVGNKQLIAKRKELVLRRLFSFQVFFLTGKKKAENSEENLD